MSDTPKIREIANIPTQSANSRIPGRTRESKAERQLRYDAQLIVEKEGIPLPQAMEVAKAVAEAEEQKRRDQQSRQARAEDLELERRHDEKKRDTTPLYPTVGPPLVGGLPTLGKKR